ncbi:MAG: hypothetical protein DMG88_03995 [Acidobacteria bacterium]|nr:MAG: hypothetical protein DMG88_03995 [Acidobacteriota bacterium]
MGIPIVALVLAILLTGSVTGPSRARPAASFSLTITALQNPVKAGSEVRIEMVVTNISNREITVSRSNGEGQAEFSGYTAEVRDRKGNLSSETKYGRGLKGEGGTPEAPTVTVTNDILFPLQPGKKLKDMLIVSRLWDMSQPGVYSIQVQRTDPDTGILVRSNSVTVTVTP